MFGMEKQFAKVDQELNSSAGAMKNVSPEGGRELTDDELEQVAGGIAGPCTCTVPVTDCPVPKPSTTVTVTYTF
jgi:hypothetical protein